LIPHGRYINFIAGFPAAENGATRAEAIAAWAELNKFDIVMNCASCVTVRLKRARKSR